MRGFFRFGEVVRRLWAVVREPKRKNKCKMLLIRQKMNMLNPPMDPVKIFKNFTGVPGALLLHNGTSAITGSTFMGIMPYAIMA